MRLFETILRSDVNTVGCNIFAGYLQTIFEFLTLEAIRGHFRGQMSILAVGLYSRDNLRQILKFWILRSLEANRGHFRGQRLILEVVLYSRYNLEQILKFWILRSLEVIGGHICPYRLILEARDLF